MKTEGRTVEASTARYHPSSGKESCRYASHSATANITTLERSKKTFTPTGLRRTISEFWSWFLEEYRASPPSINLAILSPLLSFIVLLPLCGSDALEHLRLYQETHQTVYLVRFKLLAAFPFWVLFGFLGLFVLAAFFTALFECARVSRRLMVLAFVLFLSFAGISFRCVGLSTTLQKFGDITHAPSPAFYAFAPPMVCLFALFWGWCVAWLTRRGGSEGETKNSKKGEGFRL